jgi:hypothetical protein
MRVNILVMLPGSHRLPFVAEWDGEELPTIAQVTQAMLGEKLRGPFGERVYWEGAIAITVAPDAAEIGSGVSSVRCTKCRAGTIILASEETETGALKWKGSCPACGQNVVIDDRDL